MRFLWEALPPLLLRLFVGLSRAFTASGLSSRPEKGNAITSGEVKRSYIQRRKRKIHSHPGKNKENALTSVEGPGKCSCIRGKKRHALTSGERKDKGSYIRGRIRRRQLYPGMKRQMQLHPGKEKGKVACSSTSWVGAESAPVPQLHFLREREIREFISLILLR